MFGSSNQLSLYSHHETIHYNSNKMWYQSAYKNAGDISTMLKSSNNHTYLCNTFDQFESTNITNKKRTELCDIYGPIPLLAKPMINCVLIQGSFSSCLLKYDLCT